jgi:hypothetical protein
MTRMTRIPERTQKDDRASHAAALRRPGPANAQKRNGSEPTTVAFLSVR